MNYQQEPELLIQQPTRQDMAAALAQNNQASDAFGQLNNFMQGQAMNKLKQNKLMSDMGMNNDFGPNGIPVDQWLNMRG